jgi:hypothetical protein
MSKNVKVRIFKTIILPVVLYRCETWSLTLREGYKLRMFENRVLRRIFGLKRDGVTGGWRKLQNELHNLYSLPSINRIIESRRMRWAGHMAQMGKRNVYRFFFPWPLVRERTIGRKARGKEKGRWIDNIKKDLLEMGLSIVDWIGLAQDRHSWRALVNLVTNLHVP